MLPKIVAGTTLVFFGLIAIVLLAGSYLVLFTAPVAVKPEEVPVPPEIPALGTLATDTAAAAQQIAAYQQQAAAYNDRLAAWDEYMKEWAAQRPKNPDRIAVYQAVVKDALLPLLTPIVAAFLGYAFVKGATNIVQNVMATKMPNEQLKDLHL